MQRNTTLLAAIVLVMAACGGDGDDAAPDEAPLETVPESSQEISTTLLSTEAPAAAAPAAQEIGAKVVSDGETCSYHGPPVVPDGAFMTLDFDATARADSVALVVVGLDPGTTWDQVVEAQDAFPASSEAVPSFVLVDEAGDYRVSMLVAPGTLATQVETGLYLISCNTAPDDTDKVHPAALLEVMPTGVPATVTFDGESCVYEGPSAVKSGTQISFEFEATATPDEVAFVVVGIAEGTTWDEVVEAAETLPASGQAPSFVRIDRVDVHIGPGSLLATLVGDQYLVSCNTAPEDTDRVHPAALIEVTAS